MGTKEHRKRVSCFWPNPNLLLWNAKEFSEHSDTLSVPFQVTQIQALTFLKEDTWTLALLSPDHVGLGWVTRFLWTGSSFWKKPRDSLRHCRLWNWEFNYYLPLCWCCFSTRSAPSIERWNPLKYTSWISDGTNSEP